MQKELIHMLIGRVLSGEASDFEKRQLGEWVDESAENGETYQNIEEAWMESRFNFQYPRQNEVFNRIQNNIRADAPAHSQSYSTVRKPFQWQRYAAIISFFVAATVIILWFIHQNKGESVGRKSALITKSIPTGSKLKF